MPEKEGLLISNWFPITEVSVESVRERSASSALPPLYFLHVWFARRPLACSRAAVLGSLLPVSADKKDFLELMGIPTDADLLKAQDKISQSKASGVKLAENPFYWERAFKHNLTENELNKSRSVLKKFWGTDQPIIN